MNQRMVRDIAYRKAVPTLQNQDRKGEMAIYSRRLVGGAMADWMTSQQTIKALKIAL
ncbi:MAG: hypothetical protein R6U51_08580 [Anaerolineales bacterium]